MSIAFINIEDPEARRIIAELYAMILKLQDEVRNKE